MSFYLFSYITIKDLYHYEWRSPAAILSKHTPHPTRSFSTWGTLTTTFMFIKFCYSSHTFNNVLIFIYYNDSSCSKTTFNLAINESKSIVIVSQIFFGNKGHGRSSWYYSLKIIPSSYNSTSMFFY